ncbi:MAG TPA: 3-dehydroquinate synthase [Polyangiaceae bacterium]|nr:3-dehydroquinate synthase [Polyangiaceae bacterium]
MLRPLLLNGFMGTGKSSVGRLVATRTGRRCVDLDSLVEARAGMGIARFFAERGEPAFRALEREVLLEQLARREPIVIALGGGALVNRETRLRALDEAVVVTLHASADEVLRRCASDDSRPLLAGPDRAARIQELLAARAGSYAETHASVATDGKSLDAVAAEVTAVWKRDPLAVAAGASSYAVDVGAGILTERLPVLAGAPSRIVLVSDETVFGLHGHSAVTALGSPAVVRLPPGEENKHIATVERIWRAALEAHADRKALFVALGGGVVTDMTGFAAATFMRGVRWLGIPTTLLAMVDASVGGKTGVDLMAAKNAVGAFWQPSGVICDVDVLRTETPRAFRSALAEVVKTAIIGDPDLLGAFDRAEELETVRSHELLSDMVRRSVRVKARIVSADERESGLRAVLNLGHTVGHALEAVAGYSRLTHGEAVSLGLVAALRIGVTLGFTEVSLADRVEELLRRIGLPTDVRSEPLDDAVRLIAHDKKRKASKLTFIVARDIGRVETVDLPLAELESAVLGLKRVA